MFGSHYISHDNRLYRFSLSNLIYIYQIVKEVKDHACNLETTLETSDKRRIHVIERNVSLE